jgi:DNA mismatch repair protein MutL
MIKVLDKSVSELIAAGEVIERPASVIKELIENSIDAGATSITVEIKNGGVTFMRISDNGVGIANEQCATAFLRHATSKVSAREDLDEIATLGFRGEALASVAAVARVSLLTKTADAPLGTSYKIEGGSEIELREAGCPDGTTLIIRDLFYNMPARLKFLKKDVTEGNYVQSVIDKAALVNPGIAFRFVRDNNLVRVTPGDGSLNSAIYAVYGKQFASSMTEVDCAQNGIRVSGAVSQPLFAKSNRTFQNFYVNSRYVRSTTFTAALEEAFRNSIMTGKFPACVLNIELNPADVDANVHPAKTEVRFANDRMIFSAVHIAVKNALLNAGREIAPIAAPAVAPITPAPIAAVLANETLTFASEKAEYTVTAPVFAPEPVKIEYKYLNPESFIKQAPAQQTLAPSPKSADFRVIGELFSTYIMCEQGEELLLIDKHAADERLRFERLKSELRLHSQLLLEPLEIRLGAELCGILSENSDVLLQIGIKIRAENEAVFVTAMPALLKDSQADELLSQVADALKIGGEIDGARGLCIIDEVMHRIACRAAIKAGDKSLADDIKQLAERVLSDESGDLQYCPHGRPIVVRIGKRELEKKFKRVL